MRALAITGIETASMMPVDHVGVAHPGDAALRADVGRHALQRHHRDGAGVLGDLGLLRRDHIHDHAALEHLGHAALHPGGAQLRAGAAVGIWSSGHGVSLWPRSDHGDGTSGRPAPTP